MMRVNRAAAVLALVTLVFTAHPSGQNATRPGPTFAAGQIIVKFRSGAAAVQAEAHRQAGGIVMAEIARTRAQLVRVAAGDERAAVARYQRNRNVEYAELNFIRTVEPSISSTVVDTLPGDHYFREQWALHNIGQQFYCIPWIGGELCIYVGTPDADIDAPEAWAVSTGSAVKVAVIDTGIDYTHPDLAAAFAGGYDFVTPDADPMDDHGHGTHVSGTIAASMNNLTGNPDQDEEGVVGVAPNARILAYKVCAADGTCNDFAIAQAIAQAVTDGAKVINMSLGGSDYSQSMYDAVQYAWASGLVIVAGAGNDGTTDPFYPAAFQNVISVGASDEDDLRASFSNYGWVDIAAPGNAILSAYPMSGCSASTTPGDTGCYAFNTGTSMASPHVAGAAALVWSRPDVATNWQVMDMLLNSADAGVASVPITSWTIHGRLNLHGAMTYGAAGTNQPPVANAGLDRHATDGDGDGGVMLTLDGSASSDPDGDPLTYAWRENTTLLGSGMAPAIWFTVGVHTVTLQVTDSHGASASDTVVITVEDPPPPSATLSVISISPNVVSQRVGTTTFVIAGTGFASGATVSFANGSGPAPRVIAVTRDSSTQLTARVEIRAGGGKSSRRWDVVVTNPGGQSAVGAALLTITP